MLGSSKFSGIRASAKKKNLNQKTLFQCIVDAITPKTLDSFQDKNVAESLSRIPGINPLNRTFFGEGQGVTNSCVQPDQKLNIG